MKVICAGINKTGTKTMAQALKILGYNVHDVFHQYFHEKDLWNKILSNSATQEDFEASLSDVDAVTDLPGNVLWEQLLEAFPDAKVILTVRSSEDEWFRSIKNHYEVTNEFVIFPRSYTLFSMIFFVVAGKIRREFCAFSDIFVSTCLGTPRMWGTAPEAILRSRYRQHNLYVKRTCPKEKLLVFNVKDGWEPLCKFLGVEVPDVNFPTKNVQAEFVREVAESRSLDDCNYGKITLRETQIRLASIAAFCTVLAVLFFSI